mgnify:CR=1 FL=1
MKAVFLVNVCCKRGEAVSVSVLSEKVRFKNEKPIETETDYFGLRFCSRLKRFVL